MLRYGLGFSGRFADAVQMKITSRVFGQGPKLILLHGYAGNVLHWKPLVTLLESQFEVIVVNYGHFYLGRKAMSFSQQVMALGEWILASFPGEKVHLAGISFGGALVWGLGLQFPEAIARTIFINPMPPEPGRHFQMKRMRLFFRIPLSRRAVYLFLSTSFGKEFIKKSAEIFRLQTERAAERLENLEGKKRVFLAHLFNNFAWILKEEDWGHWVERLAAWSHDGLMIYDPMDPLIQRQAYAELSDLLRCESTIQLLHAGHIAIQGEPEKISQAILAFLVKDFKKTA